MEGAKFAKLCRDSKLLSKSFSATDVDLFFAKVSNMSHLLVSHKTGSASTDAQACCVVYLEVT